MMNSSKKLLFFSLLLVCSSVIAKETKKLQLIIDPNNPSYFFALNAGDGIQGNTAPRVQGSYYVTNAFIFPGGTVSKNQSSFLVDKHGDPINFDNDNIGIAYLLETMLQTLDFNNLPAEGEVIELSQMQLQFNHTCEGNPNSIFATGFNTMGNFSIAQGQAAFELFMGVTSGLGCNSNSHHNNFTAKIYIGENGQSILVKIKFDKEIEYKD